MRPLDGASASVTGAQGEHGPSASSDAPAENKETAALAARLRKLLQDSEEQRSRRSGPAGAETGGADDYASRPRPGTPGALDDGSRSTLAYASPGSAGAEGAMSRHLPSPQNEHGSGSAERPAGTLAAETSRESPGSGAPAPGDTRASTSGATADAQAQDTASIQPRPPGDYILSSLGLSPTVAPQTPEAPRDTRLNALVDELVDRILVGRRADGTEEVRVTLKGTVLDGCEIRIARAAGGLQLQVVGADEAALDLLRSTGQPMVRELSARLASRISLEVLPAGLDADRSSSNGQGSGDAQHQRSRGLASVMAWEAE